MVVPHLFILFSSLLVSVYHVSALHVEVRGEFMPSHPTKRDHISGLDNGRNLNYMVNITLGGQPLQVLIDTGSSDLWVSEPIAAAHDTGVHSGLTYDLGAVSGKWLASNFQVMPQLLWDTTGREYQNSTIGVSGVYVEVLPTSDVPPVPGMLGLGPNAGSRVHTSLDNQSQGSAVLDRIFQQNISSPNILTVLLGRSNDPAEKYPGKITVGEILPGLENITNAPQVPVTSLPSVDSADQHWQVLLDEDGIIGPDGKPIQVQTKVQSTLNPKQLTAIFDTGYSFSQVPQGVSDAIYSGIPGASFQFVNGVGQIWVLPCDAEVNLTFKISGQAYPIHPLDTNSDDAWTNPDGHTCLGAFQPRSSRASGSYDVILGTSFLRNAYLLVNFGDFVDGSVNTTADPYVQLLSITDPASAHADFINIRLNPTPPIPGAALPNHAAIAADSASASPKPKNDIKSAFQKEKIPIIIASSIGIVLILIGVLVLCCTRNRFSKRGRDSLASTYKSYQHLGAPAPAGDTRPVQGYHLVPPPAHVNGVWSRR